MRTFNVIWDIDSSKNKSLSKLSEIKKVQCIILALYYYG